MLMKTPQRYNIETVPVAARCINPLLVYYWKGAIRHCWYTLPPNSWKKTHLRPESFLSQSQLELYWINCTDSSHHNRPPQTTEWGWSGSAPSVQYLISQFLRRLIRRCWMLDHLDPFYGNCFIWVVCLGTKQWIPFDLVILNTVKNTEPWTLWHWCFWWISLIFCHF